MTLPFLVLVPALALPTPFVAGATGLLLNPGFEADANADGRADAWSSVAGFSRSSEVVHSGTHAGRLSANDSSLTPYQQVSVTAGAAYDLSGWVNAPTTADAFSVKIQVKWRTATEPISTVPVAKYFDDTGGAWHAFSGSVVAPPGATAVRVTIAADSLIGPVYVDDFGFSAP